MIKCQVTLQTILTYFLFVRIVIGNSKNSRIIFLLFMDLDIWIIVFITVHITNSYQVGSSVRSIDMITANRVE